MTTGRPHFALFLCLVLGACTVSFGPKGNRALTQPTAVAPDHAVVVAGVRFRHPMGLKNASAFWAPFDPVSGRYTGGMDDTLQMTTYDCPQDDDPECGQFGFHYAAYKVRPGSYILNFVNAYRRQGSFGVSEVTRFSPDNTVSNGTRTGIVDAAGFSPVFHVAAGETVYIGSYVFTTAYRETRSHTQLVFVQGMALPGTVTPYQVFDFRLHAIGYDPAAAERAAAAVLGPEPSVMLRRLDNEAALRAVVRIAD